MLKAYKFRIYPSKVARKAINRTIALCRNLYNAALNERIDAYKLEGASLNYNAQQNCLPWLRQENPIFAQVHSQVLQDVLKRLDKAYQAFFRRVKSGEKEPGFPRYQGAHHYDSFTYPQTGYDISGNRLKLSKIGNVRIFLHRPLEGKIKTCTIKRKNGKYYACFSCEAAPQNQYELTGYAVGLDMGIKSFCATSDGKLFENPKHYRSAERRLKQLQRAVSRKKKGSKRRNKARLQLAKQHEHVANKRRDHAYNVAHGLLQQYDTIAHEDLRIKNMVRNEHLAKSISDAGWGIFFDILQAKAKQTLGKQVIAVNPRNTTQICSGCGEIVRKGLAVRVHKCPRCNLELDRDVNAAINILRLAVG